MNLETKWLEDFLALAELRNFSRAAQFRNVTQPAFSRRIRSLEQSLGVELIDRATTPLTLTPEGRLFRTTARNLLRQMEDGLHQLKGQSGFGPQPLDFAAAHSLSVTLLPELIQAMSHEGQMLRSRVESIDVDLAVEALQEGRCDFLLAFNIEALMQPPFLSLSLGKTELRPVCAPDAGGQPRFQLTQSAPIPILGYSPDAFMGRQVNGILRALEDSPTFQPVMESSLTNLLKVMALNGSGIAWLPGYAIVDELRSGQLVDVVSPEKRDIYWGEVEIKLYRNDIRLHAGAEQFWSALRKKCQQGWVLTPDERLI
ncbi:LysR substrate-binding domain-containing protein [Endozoicomonas ascidiicola]|uniref:LysR substrate-binding domain-containing protein n=1 Tax=Endozoicomonas ascidiicola TaxID=1698521 RepID=UPI000836F50A|nr:LysR substrate-binding domain-containing protein [Endozoicomonas ascidiicola]